MSCPNFYIENKALLVTNDDLEVENHPNLGEYNRNVDGVELSDYDFQWWSIVLKYGHYDAAIIDYTKKYDTLDEKDEVLWNCSTQTELFNFVKENYGLGIGLLRKICGKVGDRDIYDYLDEASEKIGEYLAEIEEEKVKEVIEKISEEYGYKHITCDGIFSNGEAVYSLH